MRTLGAALAAILLVSPALAHETGDEHDHELGTAKSPGNFSVTGAFGGLIGSSLGGEYEKCEAPTHCYERKRPFSSYLEGRFAYQFGGSDFAIEAGLGYIAKLNMRVARRTKLFGEQSVPVDVDIADDVSVSGTFVTIGASYTFLRKPVIGALALGFGNWWADLETTRSGTAVTAEAPSPREMKPTTSSDKASMFLVVPEARLAYPVLPNLQVGASVGGFFTFGDAAPKVVQTPVATPTDPQPKVPGTTNAIGFVPQPNAEPQTAMDSPVLFRGALFVSGVF